MTTDLLPTWPTTEPDAETLIRYWLGVGLHASAQSVDLSGRHVRSGSREDSLVVWSNALLVIAAFDRVLLLRRLIDIDRAAADEMARSMWLAAQAGGSYGELLWEWADQAGLDADAICEAARAEVTGD